MDGWMDEQLHITCITLVHLLTTWRQHHALRSSFGMMGATERVKTKVKKRAKRLIEKHEEMRQNLKEMSDAVNVLMSSCV